MDDQEQPIVTVGEDYIELYGRRYEIEDVQNSEKMHDFYVDVIAALSETEDFVIAMLEAQNDPLETELDIQEFLSMPDDGTYTIQ